MNDETGQTAGEPAHEPARRGALDPILSNHDGLFSALEEHSGPRTSGKGVGQWSHRRGEPRLLVLCWAVYLLAASGVTIMRLPDIGFADPRFVQSAARQLIFLIAVGLTVLWPMVRLSQAVPRKPATAAVVDLIALLLPLAAVLWPVTWLGRWDWRVTASVLALLGAWGMLVAAVLAIGTRSGSGLVRMGWALVCVVGVGLAPGVAVLLSGTGTDVVPLFYASPLSGVYALTTEVTGLIPTMTAREWWSSLGPAAIALLLWVGVVASRGHSPSDA